MIILSVYNYLKQACFTHISWIYHKKVQIFKDTCFFQTFLFLVRVPNRDVWKIPLSIVITRSSNYSNLRQIISIKLKAYCHIHILHPFSFIMIATLHWENFKNNDILKFVWGAFGFFGKMCCKHLEYGPFHASAHSCASKYLRAR